MSCSVLPGQFNNMMRVWFNSLIKRLLNSFSGSLIVLSAFSFLAYLKTGAERREEGGGRRSGERKRG